MIKVSISAKSLHSQMRKRLQEEVTRISKEMLNEIVDEAAEYARDQYDKALYAGEDIEGKVDVLVEDNGPMSLSLTAEWAGGGEDILPFIEYGTGSYNRNGYTNPKTKQPYWFFNGAGKDIANNGLVEQANPRAVKHEWVETPVYGTGVRKGQLIDVRTEYKALDSSKEVERPGVYFTEGNPANNVMAKTRDQILTEILPRVAREHGGKHLT